MGLWQSIAVGFFLAELAIKVVDVIAASVFSKVIAKRMATTLGKLRDQDVSFPDLATREARLAQATKGVK